MVACIGAPFAIGSFEDAVGWMLGALKPSGTLAMGDVFLQAPLAKEVAEREGVGAGDYRTLEESAAVFEAHGLALDGMIAASPDDWDRYASGSWRAAHAWAAANPDDPDRAEILSLIDGYRKGAPALHPAPLGVGDLRGAADLRPARVESNGRGVPEA